MTKEELYQKVIDPITGRLGKNKISRLHKAMIEECCENALSSIHPSKSEADLVLSVQVGFITAESTWRGLVKGSLEATGADACTINYRNESFVIDSNLKHLE